MQVEINETNIARYGLVQLTGNSVEKLLKAAKDAEENGYVLTCRIPDSDEPLEQNVFEAFDSEQAVFPDEADVIDADGNIIVSGIVIDEGLDG